MALVNIFPRRHSSVVWNLSSSVRWNLLCSTAVLEIGSFQPCYHVNFDTNNADGPTLSAGARCSYVHISSSFYYQRQSFCLSGSRVLSASSYLRISSTLSNDSRRRSQRQVAADARFLMAPIAARLFRRRRFWSPASLNELDTFPFLATAPQLRVPPYPCTDASLYASHYLSASLKSTRTI